MTKGCSGGRVNGGADDGRQFLVDGATSTASGMTALPMAHRL